jgi:hypothetical protein
MKLTLVWWAILLWQSTSYGHAEKWLTDGDDRILGTVHESFFVACEGTRVDLRLYPQLVLKDAPNMHCPRHGHLDSAADTEDDSSEQAAKERKRVDKILSTYKNKAPHLADQP